MKTQMPHHGLIVARRSPGSTGGGRPANETRRAAAVLLVSSRRGLRLNPQMPYGIWSALGPRIAARADATSWWLGDWVVFGEHRYGKRYREALEMTGLDYQTLRNYAVVARRFTLSRRRDNLSFQHHAEVCALGDEDQDRWLDLAAANRWPKSELRIRVRHAMRRDDRPISHHTLRLAVDLPREERWREAAATCRCDFEEWMVRSLDQAASVGRA